MSMTETHKYDDIINMPHHVSHSRPRMSNYDRAAQFSPFAALTGYGDAVKETERVTDNKLELTEDEKQSLNEKFQIILENLHDNPQITITYFEPDKKKEGGVYLTKIGKIKEIDIIEHRIVFTDKSFVKTDCIKNITSPIIDRFYAE